MTTLSAIVVIYFILFLYSFYTVGGWPLVGWIVLLLFVIEQSILFLFKSMGNWHHRDLLDRALRRGSQGGALCVIAGLIYIAPYVWLYGWDSFISERIPSVMHDPVGSPFAALCVVLLTIGAIRFRAGIVAAGARDPIAWWKALFQFGLGLALTLYLSFVFQWSQVWDSVGLYIVIVIFSSAGLWGAISGAIKVVLLSVWFVEKRIKARRLRRLKKELEKKSLYGKGRMSDE